MHMEIKSKSVLKIYYVKEVISTYELNQVEKNPKPIVDIHRLFSHHLYQEVLRDWENMDEFG
jgi:hypothetical protein